MDLASRQRQLPATTTSQSQALPSIASLTSSLSPSEQSPIRHSHHSEAREARDSGNWSISQGPSKRESPCQAFTLHQSDAGRSNACFQTHPQSPTPWACNYRQFSTPKTRPLVTRLPRHRPRLDIHLACIRYASLSRRVRHSDAKPAKCTPLAQPRVRQQA